MLLVLGYWCFLFLSTSLIGLTFQKVLHLKGLHPAITIALGCFGITLFASFFAFFYALDGYFDLLLGFLLLAASVTNRTKFSPYLQYCSTLLLKFPLFLKILFLITVVFAAAKSAGVPFIIDNESYYLQTIKWLDSYGIVKGIANIHPFLDQVSGWHIFESALNLNSIFKGFNDANGFLLVIATSYAFSHLHQYKNGRLEFLFIGLFPIFNLLLFQFIDAPSPDLPVYILGYFVFSEFLKEMKSVSETNYNGFILISLLVIFSIYLKVSALALLIFPMYLLYINNRVPKNTLLKIGFIGFVSAFCFILKNYYTSGYPLYPLALFEANVPWKLPKSIFEFITEQTKYFGYGMTETIFLKSTLFQRIWHWLFLPGLHGLFNKAMVLLLFIAPFYIQKMSFKKSFLVLYFASVIQLILVLSASPQYRFYLLFFMLLCLLVLVRFVRKQWLHRALLVSSIGAIAITLFLPVSLQKITTNQHLQNLVPFQKETILIPHPSTRYATANFESVSEGNFTFFSAMNIDFFWATGDGPLPCVKKQQINYFKETHGRVPQFISEKVSDGFYSKKIAE
ncbi:LIC_10190 family membrane protein [Cochleicola gelatinilyticus]|uniref:DUF8201 domain-containing protein n=1 Tax=Cochleicola gelatinilyticus TaxID=1763537 RepID=A0A167H233_9FLAO|nr:hypothetical protein [Cochleicola gelatinilyticus]OAB78132.1 hypothetical protein ULVI_11665 [Cochleicola gelatinilyticus]